MLPLERALTLHRNGDFDEAQRAYEAILGADATNFEASYYFSFLRAARGDVAQACALAEVAAAARPDSVEAQVQAGSLLVLQHRPDDALAYFERALQLAPEHPRGLNNYGGALRGVERYEEALEAYRRAAQLDPDYVDAHYNTGAVLLLLNRPQEAMEPLERALSLEPAHADACNSLGAAYWALGDATNAMERYRAALSLDPGLAQAYGNIGNLLGENGRLEEAVQAFERAAELAPSHVEFLRHLMAYKPTPQARARLEALEHQPLPPADRIELHFALGDACLAAGERRRSFEHFLAGNQLKRRRTQYDEAAMLDYFRDLEAAFTAGAIGRLSGLGNPSEIPVFIIGMPRSGTTLLEQMLASHPLVYGAGELNEFSEAVQQTLTRTGAGPWRPQTLAALPADAWSRTGLDYVAAVARLSPDAVRITDKMPANFLLAGPIHLALPHARIIHMQRDAVDTCLSCFSQLFTNDQPWSYDLAELGRYYRAYERLMAHWRRVLPPGRMLEVRYEELVSDFETQSRRVVEHCGLAWDDACLEFHKTQRPVKTASAAQVRRPLYTSSVARARSREYADLLSRLYEALEMPAQN